MAKVYLDSNESFRMLNDATVYGTGMGTETVIIMGYPDIRMDGNVERLELTGNLADYNFQVSGTALSIFRSGNAVGNFSSINSNVTLAFAGGATTLALTGLNSATLGGQAISTSTGGSAIDTTLNPADVSTVGDYVPDDTTTPSYTTVSADIGTISAPQSLDASTDEFKFTDDPTAENYVQISGFTSNDLIEITQTPAEAYSFQNNGADVDIIANINSTVSRMTLIGVVDSNALVYDEASFEAAIGFDAFTIA